MENPYYSPNPAPNQQPVPAESVTTTTTVGGTTTGATTVITPTKDSNFRLIVGVFVVLILLFLIFIIYSATRGATTPLENNGIVQDSVTDQDVANDPLDEEDDTTIETEIYSSENFNLTFHYPSAYGTHSTEYDDGSKNPRCTYEKITFSTSTSEIYIYNDRELGAQTCVASFAGTSVEGYTNTNAYGNAYSIAVLEVNGKFQAVGTAMIIGADETEFITLFVTEGTTAEEARDAIDALINKAEFDPEFK